MTTRTRGTDILVVDDDGLTRDALAMTLEAAGYTVRQAADGREAFRQLCLPPPPSAILLDIVMPGMGGWEFLRERDASHPELAGIPVIVFSVACEAAPRMPLPRGVARLLPKPVDGGEVLAAVGDLLDALEQQGPSGEGAEGAVATSVATSAQDALGATAGLMRRYPLGSLCVGIGVGFLLSRVLEKRATGR
jgi:CheY-like chemotaxis protein